PMDVRFNEPRNQGQLACFEIICVVGLADIGNDTDMFDATTANNNAARGKRLERREDASGIQYQPGFTHDRRSDVRVFFASCRYPRSAVVPHLLWNIPLPP